MTGQARIGDILKLAKEHPPGPYLVEDPVVISRDELGWLRSQIRGAPTYPMIWPDGAYSFTVIGSEGEECEACEYMSHSEAKDMLCYGDDSLRPDYRETALKLFAKGWRRYVIRPKSAELDAGGAFTILKTDRFAVRVCPAHPGEGE